MTELKEIEVKWTIELKKVVKAKNTDAARNIIENIDCQHDGSYVEDSFKIIYVGENIWGL